MGSKVVKMVHEGPGGGPQGPQLHVCNLQTSSFPDPEVEQSSFILCVDTFLGE